MYQVTAVCLGSEIGYGEAESYAQAMNDAIESIGSGLGDVYHPDDVVLECQQGCVKVETPLEVWQDFNR